MGFDNRGVSAVFSSFEAIPFPKQKSGSHSSSVWRRGLNSKSNYKGSLLNKLKSRNFRLND